MKPEDCPTLAHVLQARAQATPQRRAFSFSVDGDRQLVHSSYGELDASARAVAYRLKTELEQGDRVLLLFAPGLGFIEALFACFYAGVVGVSAFPPNPGDLRRSAELLGLIAKDAQPRMILVDRMLEPFIRASVGAAGLGLEGIPIVALDDAKKSGTPLETCDATSERVAMLQYTSGSVSAPKGVVLSHGNLMASQRVISRVVPTSEDEHFVSWLPLQHDMGLVGCVMQPIYAGLNGTLLSPLDFIQRPLRWLEAASREQAAVLVAPNFGYELCVRRVKAEEVGALDLSTVRLALTGAETVRADTLRRFAETFGAAGFKSSAFRPVYGLAEATLLVTGGTREREPVVGTFGLEALGSGVAQDVAADGEVAAATVVGCGGVAEAHELSIVHPGTRERCGDRFVGEIWVRGPAVAQGYWRNEEATQALFAAHTADGAGPYLRTGDLGFCIDGELFVTGRLKDVIIVRGRNLYPQDIERTVDETHPALRPGCGVAFAVTVDDEEQIVIVQELDARKQVDHDALIDAIRERVALRHQVTVHEVCLVHARTLPKTSSGKLRRAATRAAFLESALTMVRERTSSLADGTLMGSG